MSKDPILLTPGPLTTTLRTKEAMLSDYGSWDSRFQNLTQEIRNKLIQLINGTKEFTCVPMQGSGSYAVEAAISSLVPENGKVLIPHNGAYCERIAKICHNLKLKTVIHRISENQIVNPKHIEDFLSVDPDITHIALVHCETSSGILNPLPEIAAIVRKFNRSLIIDAMSSFAAIEITSQISFVAVIASANKCLEGVPGFGFVLVHEETLKNSKGLARSYTLDLYDQWEYMERTRQWRFTPPTHVVAAFHEALKAYDEEGGQKARLKRYQENADTLIAGMRNLGFQTFIDDKYISPIIVTFYMPRDPNFIFETFYLKLKERGFIIYPGKLTMANTFRIGCIGAINKTDIIRLLQNIEMVLKEMSIVICEGAC